ncbi:MAG TPA: protein kinase, partial [Polyangia bacterium]|nr:protein kinase [Polyangia bacterium]
ARSEPLDGRTDLYAAGILLWELLTGHQLFPVKAAPAGDEEARRDSTADALARVRDPKVIAPSQVTPRVPPELDAIVMRALAREPARRYQSGEALRADLAAFLASTTPETDAARLAAFLRPLFHDVAEKEGEERDLLLRGAAGLLSGAFSAEGPAAALAGVPGPVSHQDQPDRSVGRRHTDTAPRFGPPPDGGDRRASAATPIGHEHVGRASGVGRLGEDPRVGSTLGGRYYLERLCVEGAMGRVYEARHVDIGRRLAVKILHSSFRHSEEVVERFRREARAASKIGHPNIVDVTDSGTTPDGAFYFVMEFLDGVDLEQLIQRDGALPLERALVITAQLTRALQAAHASEIIHRDLKPANVMLVNRKDDDDFVKVLDFGISRNMDLEGSGDDVPGVAKRGLTRPDVAVGTPVYMSPEQAAGMRADALTDVYAVGGLLYEMLTATPPCAGDDVLTVLNKKATEDPVPIGQLRPELPDDVQRLVMRALSRRPKDRQASMTALKDEVMRCLSSTQGTPPPISPELRQPVSSRAHTRARRSTERLTTLRARSWMIAAGVGSLVALMAVVSFVRRTHSVDVPAPARAESVAVVAAPPPAPEVVPVAPPPAADPVNLKRPARVVETAPSAPPPWPAASPPVFPQAQPTARRTTVHGEHAAPAGAVVSGTAGAPVIPGAPSSAPAPAAPPVAAKTVAVDSSSVDAILGRGQAAFDRGNYPEAIRRAREAIAAGGAVSGHLLVADAYYHLQRYSDALKEYEVTLALEPSNALARRGRELAARAAASGTN